MLERARKAQKPLPSEPPGAEACEAEDDFEMTVVKRDPEECWTRPGMKAMMVLAAIREEQALEQLRVAITELPWLSLTTKPPKFCGGIQSQPSRRQIW